MLYPPPNHIFLNHFGSQESAINMMTRHECNDDDGCRHTLHGSSLSGICPPSIHKPNKTVCLEGQNQGHITERAGSICLAYGLESCRHSQQPWNSCCKLCSKQPEYVSPCHSSMQLNQAPWDVPDLYAKPAGSPCKNYTAYCDAYRTCPEVDPTVPSTTSTEEGLCARANVITHWVETHWYAVVGGFIAPVIAMMVLAAKLCGIQANCKDNKVPKRCRTVCRKNRARIITWLWAILVLCSIRLQLVQCAPIKDSDVPQQTEEVNKHQAELNTTQQAEFNKLVVELHKQQEDRIDHLQTLMVIVIVIGVILLVGGVIFVMFIMKKLGSIGDKLESLGDKFEALEVKFEALETLRTGDDLEGPIGKGTVSSGRRPLTDQVVLLRPIGNGAAGTVWRAKWTKDGEKIDVAVKRFEITKKPSWTHEKSIFDILKPLNESILQCYLSEEVKYLGRQECWILTEYHEQGSLFHFLQTLSISKTELLEFIQNIFDGLQYLHDGGADNVGRAKISHRDIKSPNILVRNIGNKKVCVIADFGLAVSCDDKTGELNIISSDKKRVGTPRYMAPEVLNETIEMDKFESFTKCDIYSSSLVIWELYRRCCQVGETTSEMYEKPFENDVQDGAEIDAEEQQNQMRKVICEDKQKPEQPRILSHEPLLASIYNTVIEKGLEMDPKSRISAATARTKVRELVEADRFAGIPHE